jgi:hypothetical protein
MKTSEQINELAVALAGMQGEMQPAKMNATNPFLKNRYADLAAVIEAVKPHMSKYGLSYVQMPTAPLTGEYGISLTTRLMHKSGQWLEDTFFMPMPAEERGKSTMQVAGSAISYARRYALSAMLGVIADEDGDGNGAPHGQNGQNGGNQQRRPQAPPPAPPAPAPVNGAGRDPMTVKGELLGAALKGSAAPAKENQLKFVRASLSKLVKDDAEKAKAIIRFVFSISSTAELTAGQASALIDWAGANKDNGYTVNPASAQEAERIAAQGSTQAPIEPDWLDEPMDTSAYA